jgi:hypothetical protein
MSGMRTIGVSQTPKRLEKEKKNLRDGGSREAYEGRGAIHSRAHPWSKDRVGR